jgi:hypothetical protein
MLNWLPNHQTPVTSIQSTNNMGAPKEQPSLRSSTHRYMESIYRIGIEVFEHLWFEQFRVRSALGRAPFCVHFYFSFQVGCHSLLHVPEPDFEGWCPCLYRSGDNRLHRFLGHEKYIWKVGLYPKTILECSLDWGGITSSYWMAPRSGNLSLTT